MNIAYLDLNYPDHFEDYSYMPKKYGGGRIVAAAFLNQSPTSDIKFYVHADERSFSSVAADSKKFCVNLSWEQRKAIRDGKAVKDVIPFAEMYDLFFHASTNIHLNLEGLKAKQVVWSIGWSETVNPANEHLICFDFKHQQPLTSSTTHKLYHAVIGPNVEPFQEYEKQDFIFQCTRHTGCFQSMLVAQFALKHRIQTIFAGPIEHGYPLMDYIDNKVTFYLGEISQEEKIRYNKLAKFHTQLQNYPTCATLSAKESLSYGTPIIAMPIGGWPDFIKQGVNGFIIQSEQQFLDAWNSRDKIKQKDCYDTASEHSEAKMIEQFTEAFKKVVNGTSESTTS